MSFFRLNDLSSLIQPQEKPPRQKCSKRPLLLMLILVLSVFSVFLYALCFRADRQFDRLCLEIEQDLIPKDALSLAFLFDDPPEAETLLPVYDKASYRQAARKDYLACLQRINADRLSEKNAVFYDLLTDYFTLHRDDSSYLYLEQPLSPTGGVQTELPVLLAEFPVQNKEDIEQYLSILEAIPAYLASLGEYEKDRKEAGFLTPTEDIRLIIAQCDKMCSEKGYELFTEGFSHLLSQAEGISSSEKECYEAECDRIVTTMIFPAYEALGDTLLLLREEGVDPKGLCGHGQRDYYAHLLSLKTGSSKSVPQIEKCLQNRFQILASDFNRTFADLTKTANAIEPAVVTGSPKELLNLLQERMQTEFPPLPPGIGSQVKSVPDCLQDYTAPAYYFTPQADNISDNRIYINEQDITDPLSLYTTLAHEGYPGHMLQSTYFLSLTLPDDLSRRSRLKPTMRNALRMTMNYIGYIEGWAMYTELLSYDHAARQDPPSDFDQKCLNALRLSRELKICLYCMLDIRVHYYGDQKSDLFPYLNNIGIRDEKTIDAVYHYLINEPATYASYYVGFLEVLECKESYKNYCLEQGLPYSDRAFHEFYLKCGPCSFAHLHRLLSAASLSKTR